MRIGGGAGGGDDVSDDDDPDSGDARTRRLRDDADSDPANPQTEEVDVSSTSTTPGNASQRRGRDGTTPTREPVTGTTSPSGDDIGSEDAESTDESTTVDRDFSGGGGSDSSDDDGGGSSSSSGDSGGSSSSDDSSSPTPGNIDQRQGRDDTSETRESVSGTTSPTGVVIGSEDAVSTERSLSQDEVRESARFRERVAGSVSDQVEEQTGEDLQQGEDFSVEQEIVPGRSPTSSELDRAANLREAGAEEEARQYLRRQTASRRVGAGNITEEGRQQIRDGTGQSVETREQPGRQDDDFFSGAVSEFEDRTGVDLPGEGSVVNVAQQEETDLTADLGPVSDVGDTLGRWGDTVQSDVIQPAAETAGDVFDIAQSGYRVSAANRPSNLLAQSAGVDTGADIETIEGEVDSGPDRVGDIARGEEQELTESRTFERFGEGSVQGSLGMLNIPAAGSTVVQGGEFVVEGGSRTLEGEGGEFATEAGGQAAVAGAQAGEFATENPAQFTGQVTGGLAASTATLGVSSTLGGARAARAASYAIQPGEELALAAARRGLPGSRRVSSVVSDVGPGRGSVDLSGPISRSRQRLSETTPDVSVTVSRAPDAPMLDVASGVSRSDLSAGVRQRARSGVETVREAPSRVRERTRTAQQQTQLDLAAGRQAASDVSDTVLGAPSRARSAIGDRAGNVRTGVRERAERASQQAQLDAASGEQAISESVSRARQVPQDIELGARRTARDIGNVIGEVRAEGQRRASTGLLGDESTGRVSLGVTDRPTSGDLVPAARSQAESLRFDVTQSLASAERRASSAARTVSDAPSRMRLEARRAARDVPDAVGSVTGEARRRASTGLLGDESTGRARPSGLSISNPLSGITDHTVRVDVGRPGRSGTTDVDADDIEIDTTGTASVTDFDGIDSGPRTDFESDFDVDPQPQQAASVSRSDTGIDTTRTGTGTDAFGSPVTRTLRATEPSVGSGPVPDSRTAAEVTGPTLDDELGASISEGEATTSITESRTDPTTDAWSGLGVESRFEGAQGTRSDVRQELQSELNQEGQWTSESRQETDPELDTVMSRRESDEPAGRPGWAQRVDNSLINPFTGQ